MNAIACVQSYQELKKALIALRHELGLSQLEVDDIAGLQSGYLSKLECGMKNMGPMSLDALLGALGLKLVVVRSEVFHRALAHALACKAG